MCSSDLHDLDAARVTRLGRRRREAFAIRQQDPRGQHVQHDSDGPFQAPPPTPANHAMNAALFGAESLPASDSLKVHCPCCGAMLALPAFPPHVAFCDQCGAKTAVRKEDQGRLMINTAPPGVTRRPVG